MHKPLMIETAASNHNPSANLAHMSAIVFYLRNALIVLSNAVILGNYLCLSISGYGTFGKATKPNIMENLGQRCSEPTPWGWARGPCTQVATLKSCRVAMAKVFTLLQLIIYKLT